MTCKTCGNPTYKKPTALYCAPCRKTRDTHRAPLLSREQVDQALSMVGRATMPEIASAVGCSRASLARLAKQHGFRYRVDKYDAATVSAVVEHYQQHGRASARDAFPDISVGSILRRYDIDMRRPAYGDGEILQAALLGGIATTAQMAKILNRPECKSVGIRSLWSRRIKIPMTRVHGICWASSRFIFKRHVPTMRIPQAGKTSSRARIILWSEAPPFLIEGAPPSLVTAFDSMAQFQLWLFGGRNPRECILEMMGQLAGGKYG